MLKLLTNHAPPEVWVIDKTFNIGSEENNHCVIDDATVCPHHARLTFDGKNYQLRDLGSINGSFVNGQRVNQRQIRSGDNLRLGDVSITVIDPLEHGAQKEWCLVANSNRLPQPAFLLQLKPQQDEIKIGRSSHCDLIFPGTHLSREHASIRIQDGFLEVEDLNSANGTFINDQRIEQGKLYPGDMLRLDIYGFYVFGPGQPAIRPAMHSEAKPHSSLAKPDENPLEQAANEDVQKQWKTRPTSPGNRPGEEAPQRSNTHSLTLILGAVIALTCFAALGAYLWLI